MYAIKTDYSKNCNRKRVYHLMVSGTRKTECGICLIHLDWHKQRASIHKGWLMTKDKNYIANRVICKNCATLVKQKQKKHFLWRVLYWLKIVR